MSKKTFSLVTQIQVLFVVSDDRNEVDVDVEDDDVDDEQDVWFVDCLQENDYLQECLEVVQQEFMIFNRER